MMAVTMQQMEDSYLSMMAGDTKHYWLSSSPVVRARQQQLNPYDYASDWDYRQACKEINARKYTISQHQSGTRYVCAGHN